MLVNAINGGGGRVCLHPFRRPWSRSSLFRIEAGWMLKYGGMGPGDSFSEAQRLWRGKNCPVRNKVYFEKRSRKKQEIRKK